ncbi:MAG: RsmB/NOP family class I SAM-dependent RNA methyltransferase [Pseudomonadota bacterium]
MTKSASPHPARAAALKLLAGVAEGSPMSELTPQDWFGALEPADRARSQRLALETLRHGDRADRVLKRLMRKAPPEDVMHILRLGVVEIAALGGAAHGVVGDMVSAAGAGKRTRGYKSMVNAVLRRASAEVDGRWGKLPVPRMPRWLRGPLAEAYGNSVVQGLETAHMRGAPLDITAKGDAEALAEKLGGELLPNGSVRLREYGQISALPGYEDGAWWVQDAAAAFPVQVLAPQKGERIADLCAAPGGKTMQLAAAGAEVTAVDVSAARLERVRENLTRARLSAEIVAADVLSFQGQFDAVLLDAPCSATGTIRRHPDLPFARDGSGITELIELQARMLDHALGLVKPGGRLVFCTCSLLPDEGEVQVEEALKRREGVVADRAALVRPGIDPQWITEEGGLRLRPDYWSAQGGMDGFYIACLKRV